MELVYEAAAERRVMPAELARAFSAPLAVWRATILRGQTLTAATSYFLVAAGAGAFFAAGATGSGKIMVADLMLSSSGKFLSR
jgi:hypothetical protein